MLHLRCLLWFYVRLCKGIKLNLIRLRHEYFDENPPSFLTADFFKPLKVELNQSKMNFCFWYFYVRLYAVNLFISNAEIYSFQIQKHQRRLNICDGTL